MSVTPMGWFARQTECAVIHEEGGHQRNRSAPSGNVNRMSYRSHGRPLIMGGELFPARSQASKEIPMSDPNFNSTSTSRAVQGKSPATTERMTPTRHQAEEAISCGHSSVSPEHIAIAAYFRAERRGFAPGGDLDDWLTAEQELQNGPDSEDVSSS